MPEGETPFLLPDSNTLTELEQQISILSPEYKQKYNDLELYVGNVFVDLYGEYLTEEQKKYLTSVQIIFTDYEHASTFAETWDEGIESIDKDRSTIDGKIYTSYSVGHEVTDQTHNGETDVGSSVRQYWAGRIAIYPLSPDEIYDVDPKFLMTQEKFDTTIDSLEIDEAYAQIGPYVYTNSIAGAALHEKVHGIQDPFLPLPILEAAAHYYQREVGKIKRWEFKIGSNMEQFANLWEECLKEIGPDLHAFIFQNITDSKREKQIIEQLKKKFTAKKIEELSTYQEFSFDKQQWKWIYWQTGN